MPEAQPAGSDKIEFTCLRCHRPIRASRQWVNMEIRCPHCESTLRVPDPAGSGFLGQARPPSRSPQRYFNFVCKRCNSILEAHSGMCGQSGHCPTCDAFFIIPHVNPHTGMPLGPADPGGEPQNPTPVHAYAASGESAPQIVTNEDGASSIQCAKCDAHSRLDANSCSACGTPFTLEGAATAGRWDTEGSATVACILGIISIPLCMLIVPGLLATCLGGLSLRGTSPGNRPMTGIVGLALGLISVALGAILRLI